MNTTKIYTVCMNYLIWAQVPLGRLLLTFSQHCVNFIWDQNIWTKRFSEIKQLQSKESL